MVKKFTHTLVHFNYLVQPTGAVSVMNTVVPAKFISNQFDAIGLYDHFYTQNIEDRKDFFKFVKKVKQYECQIDMSIFKPENEREAYKLQWHNTKDEDVQS